MSERGATRKIKTDREIRLERAMVIRYYIMLWDLERCVGCQIGPLVCPKDAITHVSGEIVNGKLSRRPSVDIDPAKCVLCGMCEIVCPKRAITMTINSKRENPVLRYEAFPLPIHSTTFHKERFDWSRKQFVMDNCPTKTISHDEAEDTLTVDDAHCIRCRQCEIASNGAFEVQQPWQGKVELRRELCREGCFACADICPTRALSVNEQGELVLADYYCIKCGACMQVCPVKPEYEEYDFTFESQGVTATEKRRRITNPHALPIRVEHWRMRHAPVRSAAWVTALGKMAEEKAGLMEMDMKNALKRKDLLVVLKGHEAAIRPQKG